MIVIMLGILRFLKENLLWHNFKDYWSVGTKIHKIGMKETICTKNLWKKFFSLIIIQMSRLLTWIFSI